MQARVAKSRIRYCVLFWNMLIPGEIRVEINLQGCSIVAVGVEGREGARTEVGQLCCGLSTSIDCLICVIL